MSAYRDDFYSHLPTRPSTPSFLRSTCPKCYIRQKLSKFPSELLGEIIVRVATPSSVALLAEHHP